MSRSIDLQNPKILNDCYEFLHMVELGRSSIAELIDVFGLSENLDSSNYRQVERIKRRCMQLGIYVEFDHETSSFTTETNAKLKLLELAENQPVQPTTPRRRARRFGPFEAVKLPPRC